MRQIHRLSALLLAGSFALQALPASAMSLGLDLSHSSYVDSSFGSRTRNHVSEGSETSLQAGSQAQGTARASTSIAASSALIAKASHEDDEDTVKADMGLHLGWYNHSGTGSTNADMKVKLERKQTMFEGMIKRAVNAVAQISLRICKLAGGTGDTVKKCLVDRRDAFKLRVTAMIDAAFNITL
jgi:hypothetical protein